MVGRCRRHRQLRTSLQGHNYTGHDYLGHNDVGRNYVNHEYVCHNYVGLNCINALTVIEPRQPHRQLISALYRLDLGIADGRRGGHF